MKYEEKLTLFLRTIRRSAVLWAYGWKRRKCSSYGNVYIEWKDPESTLQFSEGTAYKMALERAAEESRRYD